MTDFPAMTHRFEIRRQRPGRPERQDGIHGRNEDEPRRKRGNEKSRPDESECDGRPPAVQKEGKEDGTDNRREIDRGTDDGEILELAVEDSCFPPELGRPDGEPRACLKNVGVGRAEAEGGEKERRNAETGDEPFRTASACASLLSRFM